MHFILVALSSLVAVSRAADLNRRPLSNQYPLEEGDGSDDDSKRYKWLGRNELRVNEALNLTKVMVRGREEVLFEGDMIAPRLRERVLSDVPVLQKASTSGLWPNGRVPYTFGSSLSKYKREVIRDAMSHWTSRTCIKFVRKTSADTDYVEFFSGEGCYSDLGVYGGKQLVSIGSRCVRMGVIAHEIGHTIGFYHEQSRPDRDEYVRIKLYNAIPGTGPNFAKYSRDSIDTHGVPYDYGSIMHYRSDAFSKNGRETVVPIVKAGEERPVIGQRQALSKRDVAMARAMYHCDADMDPGSDDCTDKTILCKGWAAQGLCSMGDYGGLMLTNCRVSCGFCEPPLLLQATPPVTAMPNITVERVDKTAVSVRVEADTGVTKVQIMKRRVEGESWSYGMVRGYDPTRRVYRVHNLRPGTEYDLVARVQKPGSEWSEFSEVVRVRTDIESEI